MHVQLTDGPVCNELLCDNYEPCWGKGEKKKSRRGADEFGTCANETQNEERRGRPGVEGVHQAHVGALRLGGVRMVTEEMKVFLAKSLHMVCRRDDRGRTELLRGTQVRHLT